MITSVCVLMLIALLTLGVSKGFENRSVGGGRQRSVGGGRQRSVEGGDAQTSELELSE